ncbi:hypothetical protein [Aliidiomarina celeris]|uniref:hypothetical protein n=1 Tax=Aliidiomarina celeris TaxID=2249428 RepID=UPI000DEB6542|nr:hypothetical protein [Aliidiomarina celeris]
MPREKTTSALIHKAFAIAAVTGSVSLLSGCVLTTTEHQSPIRDMRPQLQFTIHHNASPSDYQVFLNNLRLGTVADFLLHNESLRTLSGRQDLKIVYNDQIILERSLELDNGTRQFIHVPTEHESFQTHSDAKP